MSQQALLSHLRFLGRYHTHATRSVMRACRELTHAQYHNNSGLFFGSVHGTLNHMLCAELEWHSRLTTGKASSVAPFWSSPDARVWEEFTEGVDGTEAGLLKQAGLWEEMLAQASPQVVCERFTYERTDGSKSSAVRGLALAQVLNHATHHRGQITAVITKHLSPYTPVYPCLDLQCLEDDFAKFEYGP